MSWEGQAHSRAGPSCAVYGAWRCHQGRSLLCQYCPPKGKERGCLLQCFSCLLSGAIFSSLNVLWAWLEWQKRASSSSLGAAVAQHLLQLHAKVLHGAGLQFMGMLGIIWICKVIWRGNCAGAGMASVLEQFSMENFETSRCAYVLTHK